MKRSIVLICEYASEDEFDQVMAALYDLIRPEDNVKRRLTSPGSFDCSLITNVIVSPEYSDSTTTTTTTLSYCDGQWLI